jgi:hypothetical protein
MIKKQQPLWLRWTTANALSELLGLGASFAVIGLLVSQIDTTHASGILLAFGLTVLAGALEATLVGLCQHWAMHPWFPGIGRAAWWRGTLIGALLAYALGYLPSTLMSMNEAATGATAVEPPQWLTLLLAAGLGIAAGALLSFAQYLVLRRSARKAGRWIPANMLAWAVGMPVIFQGMDMAYRQPSMSLSVLVIAGALLLAGILVGAIHGRFLLAMAESK